MIAFRYSILNTGFYEFLLSNKNTWEMLSQTLKVIQLTFKKAMYLHYFRLI